MTAPAFRAVDDLAFTMNLSSRVRAKASLVLAHAPEAELAANPRELAAAAVLMGAWMAEEPIAKDVVARAAGLQETVVAERARSLERAVPAGY